MPSHKTSLLLFALLTSLALTGAAVAAERCVLVEMFTNTTS